MSTVGSSREPYYPRKTITALNGMYKLSVCWFEYLDVPQKCDIESAISMHKCNACEAVTAGAFKGDHSLKVADRSGRSD